MLRKAMGRTLGVLVAAVVWLAGPVVAGAQVCESAVQCVVLYPQDGFGPATNGTELVFNAAVGGLNSIVSNTRGILASGTNGQADINIHGEVVHVVQDAFGIQQVHSTIRGQITNVTDPQGAIFPAINSFGEIVYLAPDALGQSQIYSTTRGQLTFLPVGDGGFEDGPALDDFGRVVVVRGGPLLESDRNLYEIGPGGVLTQLTFFTGTQIVRQPTLAAATGELVYIIVEDCDVTVVSERDGVLFSGGNVCGPDRGSFPDLGADGELVFLDHVDGGAIPRQPAFAIRSTIGGGQCGVTGAVCELPVCEAPDADGDGEQDDTDLCPGTPNDGTPVDTAGCSVDQFCAAVDMSQGYHSAVRCRFADWMNDTLFGWPGDCRVERVGRRSFVCVAR